MRVITCDTRLVIICRWSAVYPTCAQYCMALSVRVSLSYSTSRCRTLAWMSGDDSALEPSLSGKPVAAFNLYTLAMMVGTRFMPNLEGHELLIEEVGEYEYACTLKNG